MPWPPSVSAAFILQGTTTIKWGTPFLDPFSAGAGAYTVVSSTPSDELDVSYVENGIGLKSTRIILWQGRRINITVIDDTGITPPSPGQILTMQDPLSGGSVMSFSLVDNSYNAVRKEPGQRVMQVEYLTNIEGSGTVPPA